MAYKFKFKEGLEAGVRRIAVEQLDVALESPPANAEGRAPWIHETRKNIKRIRALLRLVRSGIVPSEFRTENARLRDCARLLSPLRDRHVILERLGHLRASGDEKLEAACIWLERSIKASSAKQNRSSRDTGEDAASDPVQAALAQLKASRRRLLGLTVKGSLIDVAGHGLARCQRNGREALGEAEQAGSDEAFHDLRKTMQTSWHQTRLLEGAWPEVAAARMASAREISDLLGEFQDLSILIQLADRKAKSAATRKHAKALASAGQQQQQQLTAMALPLARRHLALPPSALADEFTECWRAASRHAHEVKRSLRSGSTPAPTKRKHDQ
ncbi:MAG: CHAD domain-containing protein [Hyphomicrobiaceae bacterium]